MASLEDTPGYGCDGAGTENEICDCLSCALKRIASATERIAYALEREISDPCEKIDQCIDKIIDKLKERLEGPVYSCEHCKSMIQQGQGGTLEYAIRCAAAKCDECDTICSGGDPTTEGKCCNYCGSPKCTCKDGSCVPVEEEEEEEGEKKFRGWCNRYTGTVIVTGKDDPHPGGGYEEVAFTVTESAALLQAQINCRQQGQPLPPIDKPPPAGSSAVGCSLSSYLDGSAASILNAAAVAANMASGSAQAHESVARLGLEGINLGTISGIATGLLRSFTGMDPILAQDLTPHLTAALGCGGSSFQETFKAVASISQTARYLGVDPEPFLVQHYYTMNAQCPQRLLTPDNAMAAYLANGMSWETLLGLYAVNGVCQQAAEWDSLAQRSKPVPLQLAVARRRKMIDRESYESGMRQLGFIDPGVSDLLFRLTEQVPTMSDIIRFMVRDADDQAVVKKFNLDEGFESKYADQLRQWSESQGITEDQARYSWRSHWRLPSPTALFTFYHRLRNKPEFGAPGQLLEEIKQAMIQDDMLPRWIPHYLEVSFRPMRLVDIRRSFQIGTLNENELVSAYQDLGYSDPTAERMVKFTKRLRDRAVINERPVKLWLRLSLKRDQAVAQLKADGIPDDVIERALASAEPDFIKSPYAKAFSRGDINANELREALTGYGVSGPAITDIIGLLSLQLRDHVILDDYKVGIVERGNAKAAMQIDGMMGSTAERLLKQVDQAVNVDFVKHCQNGIKRRFLMGELDGQEAIAELTKIGTINERAVKMVNWWGCEMKAGEKQVSAAKLCEWLARGAITATDFLSRLKRIGYSDADSALMVEDCLISVSVSQAAKAKKEAKDRLTEQNRIARLLEQQARQTQRANQQAQRNRQQIAKNRERREKTLLTAAEKMTPKCECSLFDAATRARSELRRLENDYGLNIEQSLQILILAANEFQGPGLDDFNAVVSVMAQAAVEANLSGVPTEIYIPPSTNGNTVPSS